MQSRTATVLLLASLLASAFASDELVGLVKRGDADAVLQQVGHGSLPDIPSSSGELALVIAVAKGDMRSADFLLNYHANASLPEDASKMSAMTMAFSKGDAQAARLLMKYGGNPDIADKAGKTARALVKKDAKLAKLVEAYDAEGAEAFEDAPGAWTKHSHEEHNTPYYHNESTGESRFMVPPSCGWIKSAVDGHPIYINTITHQSKWTRPKALSWKRLHSKGAEGEAYWYNYITDVTSHEAPAELPADLVSELTYDSGSYYHNTASKASSWEDPNENQWRQVADPNGRTFWYHPKTLESRWERPEELAWRTVPSDEHPGQHYYFNDKTGDSSWDKPEPLAWEKSVFNPHIEVAS